LNRIEATPGCS